MARVQWDHEERLRVATEAARLRVERSIGELDCWRQAQELLPRERRRALKAVTVINPDAREMYFKRVKELLEIKRSPPPTPEPTPAPVVEDFVPMQHELSIDDLIEMFADSLATKFAESLKRGLIEKLRDAAPAILEPYGIEAPIARHWRRPLLVVGLLPAQADLIRKRFENRYDLRFVSSQEPPQLVTAKVGNAEKILLMTNFINHSHQHAAMNAKGRENVLLVSGGITALTKQLESLVF